MRLGIVRGACLAIACLGGLSGLSAEAPGATIHLVLAADTFDAKIGKNVAADFNSVLATFKENVPAETRMLSVTPLQGQRCTPQEIQAAVDRLPVRPEDTIVVMYQGHGAYDPRIGHYLKFPRLNDAFLARSDLIARIKGRGVRLGVIATDCCNKLSLLPKKQKPVAPTLGFPRPEDQISPLFTALFLNAAGFVDLTSSRQGEESISYPSTRDQNGRESIGGGLFTTALVGLFARNKNRPLSWAQVAEGVGKDVQAAFRRLKPDGLDNADEPEKPQMTQTVVATLSVREIRPPAAPPEPPSPPFEPIEADGAGQSLGIVGFENNGRGLYIHASRPGGAAARLGLERGDVILAVNDNTIRTVRGYQKTLQQAQGAVRLVFQDVRTQQVRSADVPLDGDGFRLLPFKPAPGAPPSFGVQGTSVDGGLRVDSTVPNSPAALIELDPGDVISAINGQPIADMAQFHEAVANSPDELWFDIINIKSGKPQAMLVSLDRPVTSFPTPGPGPGPIGGRNLTFGVHGYENGGRGLQVYATRPGSPAARIGFERGDILLAIDGRPLRTADDYRAALDAADARIDVTFQDVRTAQVRTTQVELSPGAGPGAPPANGFRSVFGVYPADGTEGVVVRGVIPNSAANFSGLDPGDVITSINGTAVRTVTDLQQTLKDSPDEMAYVVRNVKTGQLQGMVTRLDR